VILSRRQLLRLAIPVGSSLVGAGVFPFKGWAGEAEPSAAPTSGEKRYLIVNADDLGLGHGINRGIFEAHTHGIVTSASVIVTGRAVEEAVREARNHPQLSLGLHVDLMHGVDPAVFLTDLDAVAREVERQFEVFMSLTGEAPTHLDSHHHLHRRYNVAHLFLEVSQRYRIPLRGFSDVVYLGGFWGKSADDQTDLNRISADALIRLAVGIAPGLTAIGCHPGYFEPGVDDAYGREREVEIRALTDPRVRRALQTGGITLASFRDYPRLSVLAQSESRRRRSETDAAKRRRAGEGARSVAAPVDK